LALVVQVELVLAVVVEVLAGMLVLGVIAGQTVAAVEGVEALLVLDLAMAEVEALGY
jgi:hypothetical protein